MVNLMVGEESVCWLKSSVSSTSFSTVTVCATEVRDTTGLSRGGSVRSAFASKVQIALGNSQYRPR
jgi:hypothetical protein